MTSEVLSAMAAASPYVAAAIATTSQTCRQQFEPGVKRAAYLARKYGRRWRSRIWRRLDEVADEIVTLTRAVTMSEREAAVRLMDSSGYEPLSDLSPQWRVKQLTMCGYKMCIQVFPEIVRSTPLFEGRLFVERRTPSTESHPSLADGRTRLLVDVCVFKAPQGEKTIFDDFTLCDDVLHMGSISSAWSFRQRIRTNTSFREFFKRFRTCLRNRGVVAESLHWNDFVGRIFLAEGVGDYEVAFDTSL